VVTKNPVTFDSLIPTTYRLTVKSSQLIAALVATRSDYESGMAFEEIRMRATLRGAAFPRTGLLEGVV